jgi:hypothetical protein
VTISVIWQEDGWLWCAADTRLVAGPNDITTTETAAKIYAIPVGISVFGDDGFPRKPNAWMQYGFTYAGAVMPATMTALTASTLLQNLLRTSDLAEPPAFEDIAQFICRLADRFMKERRNFARSESKDEGVFSAAFFGWCQIEQRHKVALIEGRIEGGFRAELQYPEPPKTDGEPWVVLGSAAKKFEQELVAYRDIEPRITLRQPRRVIEKMVADGADPTVGGATSIAAAHPHGFDLFYSVEAITLGLPQAQRIFNGLDLDTEIGQVGNYYVGMIGLD